MRTDECGRYYLTEEEKDRMIQKARGRSLAEKNPELAKQWFAEKNGDLTAEMVTYGSTFQVWWICDKNHVWRQSPNRRSAGSGCGCPICANKIIVAGYNDLATTHPEIAKFWDYERNEDLLPTQVAAGSDRKVWWIQEYFDVETGKMFLFRWESTINNQKVNGCPYLSKTHPTVLPGFNDLETKFPLLAAEWHPTKNGSLLPSQVMPNCNKKAWWLIVEQDEDGSDIVKEWEAIISHRSAGCSYRGCQSSKLETMIDKILREQQITYEREKRFVECRDKNMLPFDFYLPSNGILIELDGIQHFDPSSMFNQKSSFDDIKNHDNIKTQFCAKSKMALLRIPYKYANQKFKSQLKQFVLDFIQTKQVPPEIIDFYSQFPFSDYGKLLQKQNS